MQQRISPWKTWYAKNKDKYNTGSYTRQKRRRAVYRQRIEEIKSEKGCARCPEKDSICLDFHHLNPDDKDFNIADVLSRGYGWERIESEIKKCVVLCANCHRKESRDHFMVFVV